MGRIYPDHLQVFDGDSLAPGTAAHSFAFQNSLGKPPANGPGAAQHGVVAVRSRTARKAMSFDHPLKTLAGGTGADFH